MSYIAAELTPQAIMDGYRPGSQDWSWDDELADLANELDILWGDGPHDHCPIQLGDDGRVWDGHHRILRAHKQGVERLLALRYMPEIEVA